MTAKNKYNIIKNIKKNIIHQNEKFFNQIINNMRSFEIKDNDANQRLDKFIAKAAPKLPKNLLYKYIRKKRIKLNGKKAEISARLKAGDVVDMYINDAFFENIKKNYDFLKAGKDIDIIYEDENLIISDKKPGILCHPDKGEYSDTQIGRLQRYLYEKGEYDPDKESTFTPALANRIDRNTGGIVICAKNAEALRILNDKIKAREINKYYICIVCGKMPKNEDTLEAWLSKNENQNKVIVKQNNFTGARKIKTKYKVIRESEHFSLLEIDLLTGRTHQIRAHMAFAGHPLLGDGKYGNIKINRRFGIHKQALYAYRIYFDFKSPAGSLEYLNGKSFEVSKFPILKQFDEL